MRTIPATETLNDARLVELSRNGDRDAFGRIVEQYQALICALTYSACGNLQTSEDLAQVTFISAWCQLKNLREPAKLKSWLCRIARNVTTDSFRQQQRTPTAHAEELDANASTDAATPRDHVISKEEEAILWRSLGELPVTYREPLVLFYRQQQSVAEVADALEVSEDVVRQRLSRGRAMLTGKVTAFVEGALRQTTPGKVFTLGVLAALPAFATSAKAAAVGMTAAKAGAATKTGAALGPLAGFLPTLASGYFSFKSSLEYAKSPRERQFTIWFFGILIVALSIVVALIVGLFTQNPSLHDKKLLFWAALFFGPLSVAFMSGTFFRYQRRQIRIEEGTWVDSEAMTSEKREEYFGKLRRNSSKARVYLYLALACNMGGLAIVQFINAWNGDRGHLYFLGFLLGFTLFLSVQAWRARPRQLPPPGKSRFPGA